jgi:DNA-binding transcriptional MerR regulator
MGNGDGTDVAATLTIEQVAAGAGIPVSTVRMYQHRGLLAPPEKRGRVGYYGPEHQARLALIAELQERGFSLAGIKELLDGWAQGRSLDDVLGLSDDRGIWVAEEPVDMDVADLLDRFPGEEITPDLLRRVGELGLAEVTDDGRLRVVSPRFLEIGTQLGALGIPVAEIIDEYEVLRSATDAIADRFTALFVRRLWEPLAAEGITAADVGRITEALEQLGRLAQAVVDLTLAQAVQQRARAFLDEQAAALAAPTAKKATTAARKATPAAKKAATATKKTTATTKAARKPTGPAATKAATKRRRPSR